MQVLATDRNPDIEYEYWLPPDQYALYHGRKSPLRQAHHAANDLPWDEPATSASTATRAPAATTRAPWGKQPPRAAASCCFGQQKSFLTSALSCTENLITQKFHICHWDIVACVTRQC